MIDNGHNIFKIKPQTAPTWRQKVLYTIAEYNLGPLVEGDLVGARVAAVHAESQSDLIRQSLKLLCEIEDLTKIVTNTLLKGEITLKTVCSVKEHIRTMEQLIRNMELLSKAKPRYEVPSIADRRQKFEVVKMKCHKGEEGVKKMFNQQILTLAPVLNVSAEIYASAADEIILNAKH